jgi:thiosulfate/3-mercaptopyruvate sulfurtransferase
MPYTTLISTPDFADHLADPDFAIVDSRFDLAKPEWGEAQYRASHIPGAVYAHLDRDLSGPKTGRNGRHPLPDMDHFKAQLGQWGIDSQTQVVVYDQHNGMQASRLWWLLKYLGHEAVAVLEGGFAKWVKENRPIRSGQERRPSTTFTGEPHEAMRLTAEAVEQIRLNPAYRLIDARAPERYRGQVEPLDPVAGHIPGAVNLFNLSNVNPDGTFLAPEALRAKFTTLLGDVPATNAITYCGSGVAAAHNLLAMEVSGLTGAKLYAGSWSEWCSDPARATAQGDEALPGTEA